MTETIGTTHICPFCKLKIVADDTNRIIHHEKPICDGFNDAIRMFGLKPVVTGPIGWMKIPHGN